MPAVPVPPPVARAAGLAELAAEEISLLRTLTPAASLRVFEDLLAAGFDVIDEEIAAERQRAGDPAALARFLLDGEGR